MNTPDKYQQAVIDDCARPAGDHFVVRARAGSGKTSTILNAIERVPRGLSVLVCAFNSKIKNELARKIDERGLFADVQTLHSYGFRQCGRMQIDHSKLRRHSEPVLIGAPSEYAQSVRKAVSLAKGKLCVERQEVINLISAHTLDVPPSDEARFAEDVLTIMRACYTDKECIDFDDQIWLPVMRKSRVWQYDRVFIDETQDLNLAQIRLAQMACRPNGRIVAVGDNRQAIYAFRGADSRAMARIIDELNGYTLPLSVSYRSGKNIIREAQKWVPDIEWAPHAEDGFVGRCNESEMVKNATRGDFVVSRKNAPLVKACLQFMREGRPAFVLGQDVSADLSALVIRSKARTVAKLLDWIDNWEEKQIKKATSKNPDADVQRIADAAECIRALSENEETVDDVRAKLRTLFDDCDHDSKRITLMSTHKAKGLEADRVWMLRDTYLQRQGEEEENLAYVATTRAKSELWHVRGVS